MARIDDLKNGRKDNTTKQLTLLECIDMRLNQIQKDQQHVIQNMMKLNLCLIKALKAFHHYQGILMYFKAEQQGLKIDKKKEEKKMQRRV